MNQHTTHDPQETTEEWRAVPGFEAVYEVSNLGRVRSLPHVIPHGAHPGRTRVSPGKLLAAKPGKKGYRAVTFLVSGHRVRFEIHRLVGEAFIGPLPDEYHTHHINEDRSDNRRENLEYVSPHNHLHYHNHGEKAHRAVLTREQVIEIRALLASGFTQVEIAPRYGVSRSNIGMIERRDSWAWLDP